MRSRLQIIQNNAKVVVATSHSGATASQAAQEEPPKSDDRTFARGQAAKPTAAAEHDGAAIAANCSPTMPKPQWGLRRPCKSAATRWSVTANGRLHIAPAALPLVTVLTGIGFDPCQRTELPLIPGKALQIRFDCGKLSTKKLRLREIGIREIIFRTGKEAKCGVISGIHAFLPLRRLLLFAAGQQTHQRLPSRRGTCSNDCMQQRLRWPPRVAYRQQSQTTLTVSANIM